MPLHKGGAFCEGDKVACWLTFGASSKQVLHVPVQVRDDLLMAFNHLIPCQWVRGETTALSKKLNVLAFLF